MKHVDLNSLEDKISSHFNSLAELNMKKKANKKVIDEETNELMKLIKAACEKNLRMKVTIEGRNFCSVCKKPKIASKLLCSHNICSNCMEEQLLKCDKFYNEPIFEAKCPKCNIIMGREAINKLFPFELLMEKHKKAVDDYNSYICPICRTKNLIEGSIMLDCDHKLDRTCLKKIIEEYIDHSQVLDEDFICPYPECKKTISGAIAEGILSPEKMKKYCKLKLKLRDWGKGLMYATCSEIDCEYGIIMGEDEQEFICEFTTCPKKGISTCPHCNSTPSHKGMSCNDYFKQKYQAKNIEEFEAMCAKEGCKKCPVCTRMIKKNGGCNFMTCTTPSCSREKVYFCYYCGVRLTRNDSSSHFTDGNSYNPCKNKP